MKAWIGLTGMAIVAALAGCASVAPNYSTSPESTQGLQAARVQPAKVGEFTAEATADNTSITLRASTMTPSQGTYAKYLADAVKFDKTKVARIEWDTNYFGAIAIPRAQQEYSRLVRKLLTELFSDPDFIAALK